MIRAMEVKPREGLRIWLRFSDGSAGEVDRSDLDPPSAIKRASMNVHYRAGGAEPGYLAPDGSGLDPNVPYTSSTRLWRTTDGGDSRERLSDHLTRADPKTLGHSGGPITGDMNGPQGVRHNLRGRPRHGGHRRDLDGVGRRPRVREQGRRRELEERDAAGHAGLRARQPDRRVGVRCGEQSVTKGVRAPGFLTPGH